MDVPLASWLAGSLCYAGLSGLCLAMDRHHRQVWTGKAPAAQRGLRLAGWLLLALALWPCILAWGAAVGVVLWLGWLAVGGLLLVLLLPYRPRAAALLAALALLGSLPLLLSTAL